MVTKQEVDEFIDACLVKNKHDRAAAFRETARRAIFFFSEKERLEKELEILSDELSKYKTGSVDE